MDENFNDEHAGKGGSYLLVNGKRVLQERTDHPSASLGQAQPAVQQTEPVVDAAPAKTTSTKVKGASNA